MEQNLNCEHCNRVLGKSFGSVVAEIFCPSCKGSTQFKMVSNDSLKDIRFKFGKPIKEPKTKAVEVS